MLYSNNRKLLLSGWLQVHDAPAYCSPLRLQKYLFLYEAFSKVAQDHADFSRLKGYKRGPVFSPVWGDYTKDRKEFDARTLALYNQEKANVNELRAKRASFIVSSLSEDELSALTHQFHICHAKSQRIMSGEQQVELCENDFNEADSEIVRMLEKMYPTEMIQNSEIINVGERYFVFSKNDMAKLTEQHLDILSMVSEQKELHNPVYVEIDEDGRLCVD